MRKTALTFITFLLFCQIGFSYALDDCSDLESEYNSIKDQITTRMDTWKTMRESDPNKNAQ